MYSKETVVEFFEDLKENKDFDSSQKLLWGYFFLDSKLESLRKFTGTLEGLGYSFVNIFEAEKEHEDDVSEYYLHVEKIEYHDADSLYNRNKDFYKLAKENNISFYDGFDVGNIINSENIVR